VPAVNTFAGGGLDRMGPRRTDADESYSSFKARWLTFFGGQVDAFLRGEPDDLAIRTYWARWLSPAQ